MIASARHVEQAPSGIERLALAAVINAEQISLGLQGKVDAVTSVVMRHVANTESVTLPASTRHTRRQRRFPQF